MDRITFIIDGFNLYHSVRDASKLMGGQSTKWLDIRSLCSSYLYLFGKEATLKEIYYFSALASHIEHMRPDVVNRHKQFLRCLRGTDVIVELNRFKAKDVFCTNCQKNIKKHEEKETDVAIAVKILELFVTDQCDTVVIVSGDTDIAPAVRTANKLFPEKTVAFAFPFNRASKELKKLAPLSFSITKEKYHQHQFSDPFKLPNGKLVAKPAAW